MSDQNRIPANFWALLTGQTSGLFKNIPYAPENLSVRTCLRWMKSLGFRAIKVSKGWFSDLHEGADIVKYRDDFLNDME